ncbi:MAG: HAD-IC family P-type ATPase, partial [Thermoplasmata archaeon]|nr:HAD-IC family P-type ATPase [Thermoplasmata archaeon]
MATDPVCGMSVEERGATLRLVRDNRTYFFCSSSCLHEFAEPERALERLRRRLLIAAPLSVAVAILTYSGQPNGWPYLAFLLAAVVQFYPALPFYRGAWDAVRGRIGNMDLLIATGTSAAFAYSAAVLLLPGRLSGGYYFDASSLIVTLILAGNYLEHLTRESATGALRRLRELLPAVAHRLSVDGTEEDVPVAKVVPGDRLVTRPGERFAADGVVRSGRTRVDEAILTGESLPREKGPGDPVVAGSVNQEGAVVLEATKVGEDTFLSEVGHLLSEAETSRIPLQRTADRIAEAFVPLVLALSVIAALAWYLFGGGDGRIALLVFVSVVITACPCAFGIATPAAIVVGTGAAAEEGVLFKGHDAIERSAKVDLVLTDKTGTLTLGRPALARLLPAPGTSSERVLSLAASLEQHSEHALARAVRTAALGAGARSVSLGNLSFEPGRGVRAELDGEPLALLSLSSARAEGAALGALSPSALEAEGLGESASVLMLSGQAIGLLTFTDPVAPGALEGLRALREDGISV